MEHQYCLLYKNDRLQFGWIRESKKNRFVVVPEQGQEITCSQSRLEHVWKGQNIEEQKKALSFLRSRSQVLIEQSSNIELDVIHELCEPGNSYTLDELAENFLDEPNDEWQKATLFFSLLNNRRFFVWRKNKFHSRTQDEILRAEADEDKKAEAENRRIQEKEWAKLLLRSEKPLVGQELESQWIHFLKRLKNFLVYLDRSQEKEYFCNLFHCRLDEPIVVERLLLTCLSVAGQPLSWGRLQLQRIPIDIEFDDRELNEIKYFSNKRILDVSGVETVDQRDLTVYTVDNAETKDFDDAISWTEVNGGMILRIHITDVASYLKRDSLLFRNAENRISSLYTVKRTYPMFHPSLSEDLFSLREGQDRAAVTFHLEVDSANNITHSEIYRSIINIDGNLTYDDVDIKIENGEEEWVKLWEFCQHQKNIRMGKGALDLDRAEVKLDIANPDQILIKSLRINTNATLLIQELAILSNHQAAIYCRDHYLTSLFRTQPPYSMNRERDESDSISLRDIYIQPARISLKPDGHSALGLDCYLQVTSPIRRFLDLVNQMIILGQLAKQEMKIANEEMLVWAKRSEDYQREYSQVEKILLDHWKFKYLAQHSDEAFNAQLIRYFRNGRALVNLTDLQLYIDATVSGPKEDEVFKVKIDTIVPEHHRAVLSQYFQQT
jgi:exoribonuclease II